MIGNNKTKIVVDGKTYHVAIKQNTLFTNGIVSGSNILSNVTAGQILYGINHINESLDNINNNIGSNPTIMTATTGHTGTDNNMPSGALFDAKMTEIYNNIQDIYEVVYPSIKVTFDHAMEEEFGYPYYCYEVCVENSATGITDTKVMREDYIIFICKDSGIYNIYWRNIVTSEEKQIDTVNIDTTFVTQYEYSITPWAPNPSAISYTQEEFLKILTNQSWKMNCLTVGKLITLNNSYCNTWEVIGQNHDNTTNTIDIMTNTNINKIAFANSTTGTSATYKDSLLRPFANNTVPNAFDIEVQEKIVPMDVVTSTSTTSTSSSYLTTLVGERGKILSMTECGWSSASYRAVEGTAYEAGGSAGKYLFRSGVTNYMRTRSKYLRSSYTTYAWYSYGTLCSNVSYGTQYGVQPVIRF